MRRSQLASGVSQGRQVPTKLFSEKYTLLSTDANCAIGEDELPVVGACVDIITGRDLIIIIYISSG